MQTLADRAYLDSEFGIEQELPHAGSALENPFVFDATARELHDMARRGLVEIVYEHHAQAEEAALIDRLTFKRLR